MIDKKEYGTPQPLYDSLNEEFDFQCDVCASKDNFKHPVYFTKEDSCLDKEWPERSFMNPPYGKSENVCGKGCKKIACKKRGHHTFKHVYGLPDFVKKAYRESTKGKLVVALLPVVTDTKFFHTYIYHKAEIRFIEGRLQYEGGAGPARFPSMIVIWDGREKKRRERCSGKEKKK